MNEWYWCMFPIIRAYYILKNSNSFLRFLVKQTGCRVKSLFYSPTEVNRFLEAMILCLAHWLLNRR